MKRLLLKFDPLYITPLLLGGIVVYDAVQLVTGTLHNTLGQHGADYLSAAIGGEFTALIYFVLYRGVLKNQRQKDQSFLDVIKQQQNIIETSNKVVLQNTQLKIKIATLERNMGLPMSEDVKLDTPVSSLEDVLTSTLTKK